MAVASRSALRLVELTNHLKVHLLMLRYHHLGYALAWVHLEISIGEIDEYHAYLAAIVCIYGSWRIEHRNAMLQGKT